MNVARVERLIASNNFKEVAALAVRVSLHVLIGSVLFITLYGTAWIFRLMILNGQPSPTIHVIFNAVESIVFALGLAAFGAIIVKDIVHFVKDTFQFVKEAYKAHPNG